MFSNGPSYFSLTMFSFAMLALLSAFAQGETVDVEDRPEGSYVTLSGTAASESEDSFVLDYGGETITVQLGDRDEWRKDFNLADRKVIVYGEVDENFYQGRTIDADNILIESLNTLVAPASVDDEEGSRPRVGLEQRAGEDDTLALYGTVTSISGRSFTLDSGARQVTVDTSKLNYNPMDESGYQVVEEGDYVMAAGELNDSLFEQRKIVVGSLISYE